MEDLIEEFRTNALKVKIPGKQYKLLQMIPDKKNRGLNKILEDNISFIIDR